MNEILFNEITEDITFIMPDLTFLTTKNKQLEALCYMCSQAMRHWKSLSSQQDKIHNQVQNHMSLLKTNTPPTGIK